MPWRRRSRRTPPLDEGGPLSWSSKATMLALSTPGLAEIDLADARVGCASTSRLNSPGRSFCSPMTSA
jgi:hypothetical protein